MVPGMLRGRTFKYVLNANFGSKLSGRIGGRVSLVSSYRPYDSLRFYQSKNPWSTDENQDKMKGVINNPVRPGKPKSGKNVSTTNDAGSGVIETSPIVKEPPNTRNAKNSAKNSENKPRIRFRKSLIFIGVAGSIYIIDNSFNSSTLTRSIRALTILTYIGLKYKFTSDEGVKKFHETASELLYYLMITNKGLFIKFGQAVANQGTVFPIEFQRKFIRLYDEAPAEDWATVNATLVKELGPDYETAIFENIEHKPMASASIAQVHKATLKDGSEVAVKVQHHYIENQVGADLFVYRVMVKFQEYLFDMPMSHYARYISDQTITETKFKHELENTERLREYIRNDSTVKNLGIYIPETYPELTTEKILVMEWVDGISLINKQKLIDEKYDLTTIMNQFVTIFSKMIFKYGFIHSDPHPGNILVRMHNNQQQLVILDHGLYVALREKFRKEYCSLWKSLFAFDIQGIREVGAEWGLKSMDMFASAIQLKQIKVDEESVKPKSQKELMKSMLGDTSKFPLELLFLGRAMRIIQVTNKTMGSPVNRVNMLTNEALNCLISESSVREWFNLAKLKTSLFVSSVVFWWFRFRQIWRGDKYGDKHQGIEDSIDAYIKDTAKEMGMEMADDTPETI